MTTKTNETFELTGTAGVNYDIRLEALGNGEVAITVAGTRLVIGVAEVDDLAKFLARATRD